ncbi:hypothetical protein [Nocardiopsis sp. LOL_012]|uniref:hypothetical protein n=1 Tax=Nocardiopsis sp. LOL_012 TaxID=3345409 RepID=UPI003A84377A
MDAVAAPRKSDPLAPSPRRTAGTCSFTDLLDPRTLAATLGGASASASAAEQDLHHLLQGLLAMHLGGPQRLAWRRWRPLRPYAEPVPVPLSCEVLQVREPASPKESALGDVRVIAFRTDAQTWEMAMVTVDVPVVTTALAVAGSTGNG